MRLQLETTPAELAAKGTDLIKALSDALRPVDGELAEQLCKALPPREPELKHAALRELHKRMRDAYAAQVGRMVGDIGKVLQRSVAGRGEPLQKSGGPYVGPRGGRWADPEHTIPWDEAAAPKAPKASKRKHLFHTTGYHRMGDIKAHGLKPRRGAGTFEGGSYAAHSQGKVFLAQGYSAATEWAHKVRDQLRDASDKDAEQIPVMLRVAHRRTRKDEVGDADVRGSRFVKEGIPPEELEFYHPKKGWLPVSEWGDDTSTEHAVKERDEHGEYHHEPGEGGYTPTSKEHARAHSEATEAARAKREKAAADAQREAAEAKEKRAKAEAEAGAAKTAALESERSKYTGEKRRAKVAELLSQEKKSPIPGMKATALDGGTDVDGHRFSWREILQVDHDGKDLKKAESPFPGADELEKGAQHKYIRRIPTGKKRPRYRYIYRESAAAAAPGDHKAGEKVRIKHGDKEGHYEVTAVHAGGWVTLKHDETGHEVTAKQEWLKELFLQEYADKHAEDRKRLAGTLEKAQQHGSAKQQELARERLASHMQRFPDPAARAAELVAEHANDQAEGSKDPQAHLAAAQAQVEALERGARGGTKRLEQAKEHIDHAAKLIKPRKKGTGKPKAPGDFGSKAWSYAAITEAAQDHADFSAADAAYKRWKGEAERGGPKPPAWEGGELDAVVVYLDRKVSSPREAWDRLTVGVKKWNDPRVAEALELMREIPGYGDVRLPDDVIDWINDQVVDDYHDAEEAEFYGQGEEQFSEDAFDFNFGYNEAEAAAKSMDAAEELSKAGPYIGPRGGKWADPQHKVPWTAEGAEPKTATIPLKVHPKIGGGGEHTLHVHHAGGDKIRLSAHGPGKHGPTMPVESLKHFLNDLAGKVEGPKTDHKHIAPVLEGKAEFLGKGDDGLAFKVGDKVVKVSTTVPYVPENPGHRSPKQAVEMLRKQSEVGNLLADKGIEGVQRSTFVEHGDKGYQIKPYVEIPEKFTREQLDAIQDTLLEIHKAGYSVNDAIQAGLQDGKPVMFDVGKAEKIPEKDDRKGVYSVVTGDMEAMSRLYKEHGQVFVRRDFSVAQQRLQDVLGKWDKWLKIGDGKFAHRHLTQVVKMRAEELNATLKGKELDDALDDLDSSVWAERMELEDKGLIVPTFGPLEQGEASKSLIKAMPAPGAGFEDYSQAIADKDAAGYKRVKVHLIRRGYKLEDFEQGGPLYGWSLNALLDLARDRTDND